MENYPKWLNVLRLRNAADAEVEQRSKIQINLPVTSHKVVTAYTCPQCRLQFTTSDVEAQVRKAARTGTQYIECPKCGGTLREGHVAIVKDTQSLVNRSAKYDVANRAPSRGINTWVDKAIYGRIVQRLGEYIQRFGIDNPQLRFQRGIRSAKFPGQPKTAKGAEFTVDFIDHNNTTNKIVIQAGLTTEGELIHPHTFKTLSGTEYPLTKEAIEDLTSGKLYDVVMPDVQIPPLTYRYPDPTRFREISAGNKKMKKKAQQDPVVVDEELTAQMQQMGVTDPNDVETMKNIVKKYQAPPPIGTTPSTLPAPGGFTAGLGLASKLNMKLTKSAKIRKIAGYYYLTQKGRALFEEWDRFVTTNIDEFMPRERDTTHDPVNFDISLFTILAGVDTFESVINEYNQRPTPSPQRAIDQWIATPENLIEYMSEGAEGDLDPEEYQQNIDELNRAYDYALQKGYIGISETAELPQLEYGLPSNLPPGIASRLAKIKKIFKAKKAQEGDPYNYAKYEALYQAITDGLAFPEAYNEVRIATRGASLITQDEFDQMGRMITGESEERLAEKAVDLIKRAEVDTIKHLHKAAEQVSKEFDFENMSSTETNTWIETYVDTYNKTLDNGEGVVVASKKAHKTAIDLIANARVKRALRDKDTLVPQVDTDPDWSIATTDEFEARFDVKYEETDGGILPMEDRNYTTMFKGTASEINRRTAYADVKQRGDKWVVTPKGSEKVLGEHSTEGEAVKQLQAIEISKRKQSSIEKKAAYELTIDGQNALVQLVGGQQIAGPNSAALQTALQWIFDNPTASLEGMIAISGLPAEMLSQAVQYALTMGYVDISSGQPGEVMLEEVPPEGDVFTSKDKIEKKAEPTGLDLDADEVGQNPINYSRLKGQVQDLLRAGNIPPSKVDLHRLKDGGYSLSELRNLIDTFKVNKDTAYYPTAHAKVDTDQLQKSAEEKLSDLFKQMPLEKENITPPDKGESSAEKKIEGEVEISPQPDEEISADIDPEELAKGIEIEKEHSETLAEEIAKDHLKEIPDYYTRLEKMEEEARAEQGTDESELSEPNDVDELFDNLKGAARQDYKIQLKKAYDKIGLTGKEGQRIAENLGLHYDGIQLLEQYGQDMYSFTAGADAGHTTINATSYDEAVQKLDQARTHFAATKKSSLNLTKKSAWPWKREEEQPPEEEVVEPVARIEPPQFQTRRSPGVTGEPAEATEEEAVLVQELETSKVQIDRLQNDVKQLQAELQQKIAPIQAQIGAGGQRQLQATKQLVALMTNLGHELIQVDNQIGYYTEKIVSQKLTPSEKIKILLERFGAKAEQALVEAQKNLDKVGQVVGKYRQWPTKSSADVEVEEQYLAALYQNTYSILSGLLQDTQELSFALAA